ncbi:methyl-CpG-binding domain protein 1 isoform X11 [Crotalus tigris]|uniref:methyl-CpG-binding domain protein 1 isoform X11 n=1 Tax=Crotalus tigris TaxID=88082 RepID=UPI00192F5A1E|nr:methyl-CpG-binding domain protein 1 isoform X11 [Crotalus tigris]
MTDGWVDCPSLGPGWKRREVLRKSGTRSGHSDTYYISPRGEKIRSRVELLRLLGCSRDLTDFDYRRGIFVEPNTEALPSAPLSPTEGSPQRVKKSGKKHLLHLATTTLPSKKPPYLQMFLEPQPSPGQGLLYQKPSDLELEFLGENQVNMQSQQSELPVTLDQPVSKPRKRRYQQHLPPIPSPGNIEDVTLQESNPKEAIARCASCQGQFPEVMLPSQRRCRWLCPDCRAQRRAFNREQRYYKQIGCGVCQACQMSQDCGICSVCVLRAQSPRFHTGIKCLLRRCLKIVKKGLECGMCQACKITEDCGTCAICLRKQRPGMKRQWKCLKRRCLKRKESSLTSEWTEVPKSLSLQMPKQEQPHLHPQPPSSVTLRKETIPSASHEPTKECSILPPYIQPEQDIHYHPIKSTWVIGTDPDTQLPAVNLLIATSPQIRQEYAEPGGNCQASNDSLISAGFPQFKKLSGTSSTEVVILDDSEDNEVGPLQQIQPPVIMEVYSLGGVQPLSQLDSVLREFLAELNEIPLPAHWEVLPPLGSPDLRLVQHSKHSTMSAAVIHIRPGLFFHVVVQGLLVPQEHELYASHPARLTTVDEVVELICDLEAYQLCSGWPAGWPAGERSEACDVLVHSGCCPHCRLNPWPSGSSTH